MFYVYVLKSKYYKKSYVGYTDDIERRLNEHNVGKSSFTKKYMPWCLVYKEKFSTQNEAIKKEAFYKSRGGRRKLKEIFKQMPGRLMVGQMTLDHLIHVRIVAGQQDWTLSD